jgi:hypothetical protein
VKSSQCCWRHTRNSPPDLTDKCDARIFHPVHIHPLLPERRRTFLCNKRASTLFTDVMLVNVCRKLWSWIAVALITVWASTTAAVVVVLPVLDGRWQGNTHDVTETFSTSNALLYNKATSWATDSDCHRITDVFDSLNGEFKTYLSLHSVDWKDKQETYSQKSLNCIKRVYVYFVIL